MAHDLSPVGIFHGVLQTGKGHHTRSQRKGHPAECRTGALDTQRNHSGGDRGSLYPGHVASSSFIPRLQPIDKTAIILISTILFFVTGIMDLDDLESIPWNIILLFAGAMSIGNCLWQTGAANWMAVNWLVMFQEANWFVFVMSIAFFVMIMTNFIMNVAAIAISLPVALVIAPYLGVAGEVILFAALVTAGMPFLLLVGAAPNAIAYDSKQFTTGEFFLYGIPASIILMVVTGFAVFVLWPLMGMSVTLHLPNGIVRLPDSVSA